MIVKTYSYRYAEEILQHSSNIEIYNELMDIFKNCPLPVYKGKSKNQKSKDVVQQLHIFMKHLLVKIGNQNH